MRRLGATHRYPARRWTCEVATLYGLGRRSASARCACFVVAAPATKSGDGANWCQQQGPKAGANARQRGGRRREKGAANDAERWRGCQSARRGVRARQAAGHWCEPSIAHCPARSPLAFAEHEDFDRFCLKADLLRPAPAKPASAANCRRPVAISAQLCLDSCDFPTPVSDTGCEGLSRKSSALGAVLSCQGIDLPLRRTPDHQGPSPCRTPRQKNCRA